MASPNEFKRIIGTATIATGGTESTVIEQPSRKFSACFLIPSNWTAANITVKGCDTEGGTFAEVRDKNGNELTIVPTAGDWSVITVDECPLPYIKLVSSTAQLTADKTITYIINPY